MSPHPPSSPVPGLGLEAYTDAMVAHPGDHVAVMASGRGSARSEVVRLHHGDPSPAGPGTRTSPVPWHPPRDVTLRPQHLDLGSHLRIPDLPPLEEGLTVGAWIRPRLLHPGWTAIAARWAADDLGFGLFTAGKTLVGGLSTDGHRVGWLNAKEFVVLDVWQLVVLTYDATTGLARLHQHFRSDHHRATPHDLVVSEQQLPPRPLHPSRADLLIGALPPVHDGQVGHWAHLNGRVGGPFLADRALAVEEVKDLTTGTWPEGLLARWDLSRDVETDRVVDVSGHHHHGVAVNLPTRAVPGVAYDAAHRYLREGSYDRQPALYDAVDLHEDDLDDAGWEPVDHVAVPATADPGLYAVTVTTERERVVMPLVVSRPEAEADLVVVLPTLTWTAYCSNRSPYSFTRDGVLDRGNSLYHLHTDGSPVYYASRRRPTRTHDPTRGFEQRGAHKITANLYLLDWLEHEGLEHEVVADDDLHHRGVRALGGCRCLVLGSHPEYWTPEMLAALEAHLAGGGRVVYLGSELLLWVTTIDPRRPWVMEVRKSRLGDFHPPVPRPPGEARHSTAPVLGGAWAERGRHARDLVGVEVAAQAWHPMPSALAPGFTRTAAAADPRYRWVFAGVEEDPIGRYGLNHGSAAWMEMDGARPGAWLPGVERRVLATATHPEFWTPDPEAPTADVVLSTYPGGGAVFAAGSMTWTGSLSANGYDNGVARITRNVLDRFLARPAGESVLD